jgi:hypothetical protein
MVKDIDGIFSDDKVVGPNLEPGDYVFRIPTIPSRMVHARKRKKKGKEDYEEIHLGTVRASKPPNSFVGYKLVRFVGGDWMFMISHFTKDNRYLNHITLPLESMNKTIALFTLSFKSRVIMFINNIIKITPEISKILRVWKPVVFYSVLQCVVCGSNDTYTTLFNLYQEHVKTCKQVHAPPLTYNKFNCRFRRYNIKYPLFESKRGKDGGYVPNKRFKKLFLQN